MVSEHLIEHILLRHIVIAPEQMTLSIEKNNLKRRSNDRLQEM